MNAMVVVAAAAAIAPCVSGCYDRGATPSDAGVDAAPAPECGAGEDLARFNVTLDEGAWLDGCLEYGFSADRYWAYEDAARDEEPWMRFWFANRCASPIPGDDVDFLYTWFQDINNPESVYPPGCLPEHCAAMPRALGPGDCQSGEGCLFDGCGVPSAGTYRIWWEARGKSALRTGDAFFLVVPRP